MINLKKLLLEGVSPQSKLTEPFTLSDTDNWEYYVDEKTEIVYTRKKGTTKWLDMQSELSPANYKIAIDKIHKGPIWPIKSNNVEKDVEKDVKKVDSDNATITKAQKIILDVVSELEDIIQNNPGKHFKSFSGAINDNEKGAAKYFAKYFNKHLAPKLTKAMSMSNDNKIIISNVKTIGKVANELVDVILNSSITTMATVWNLPIIDPTTKKSEIHKITWNYL